MIWKENNFFNDCITNKYLIEIKLLLNYWWCCFVVRGKRRRNFPEGRIRLYCYKYDFPSLLIVFSFRWLHWFVLDVFSLLSFGYRRSKNMNSVNFPYKNESLKKKKLPLSLACDSASSLCTHLECLWMQILLNFLVNVFFLHRVTR